MLPRSATEIGFAGSLGRLEHGERRVERAGLRVHVAGFQSFGDAALAHSTASMLKPAMVAASGWAPPMRRDRP